MNFTCPSCFNGGVCVAAETCTCPPPWSGNSDFAYGTPSCAVYIPVIVALWAIVATVYALGELQLGAWGVWLYCLEPTQSDSKIQTLIAALFLVHFAHAVCVIVTAVLRAALPLNTIGTDPLVTVFFSLAWILGIASQCLSGWRFSILNDNILNAPKVVSGAKWYRRAFPFIALVLTGLSAGVFLAMLSARTFVSMYQLTSIHFAGFFGFLSLILVPTLLFLFNPIIDTLQSSAGTNPLKGSLESTRNQRHLHAAHLERFKRLRRVWVWLIVTSSVLGFTFAFVPLLNFAGASYFNPWFLFNSGLSTTASTVAHFRHEDVSKAPWGIKLLMRIFHRDGLSQDPGHIASPASSEKRSSKSPAPSVVQLTVSSEHQVIQNQGKESSAV